MNKFILTVVLALSPVISMFCTTDYIPKEFFGMHIHEIENYTENLDFKLNAIRIWDAGVIWPDLEKEKGKWDFTRLEATVELAVSNNLEVLMTLGQTPGWASNKENVYYPYGRTDILTSPPDDIKDWENYVRTLGERYKGKIKYWEVWNEPDHLYFYSGTRQQLVELTKSVYKILKEIDPANMIVCPSVTAMPGSLIWLERYLSLGAKDYIDIVGYHYYTLSWVHPEMIRYHLSGIKSLMNRQHISDKPIWTTEAGIMFSSITYETFISYIARMYIIQRYYGSERFYWYAMDNGNIPASGGLLDDEKKHLNPAGIAYKKLSDWLIGKKITKISNWGSLFAAFLETGEGRTEIIIWTTAGRTNYRLPAGFNASAVESLDGSPVTMPANGRIRGGLIPLLIN